MYYAKSDIHDCKWPRKLEIRIITRARSRDSKDNELSSINSETQSSLFRLRSCGNYTKTNLFSKPSHKAPALMKRMYEPLW